MQAGQAARFTASQGGIASAVVAGFTGLIVGMFLALTISRQNH